MNKPNTKKKSIKKPPKYSKPVNLPPVFDKAMKAILQVDSKKK